MWFLILQQTGLLLSLGNYSSSNRISESLVQRLANFFCKDPYSENFRLCGLDHSTLPFCQESIHSQCVSGQACSYKSYKNRLQARFGPGGFSLPTLGDIIPNGASKWHSPLSSAPNPLKAPGLAIALLPQGLCTGCSLYL